MKQNIILIIILIGLFIFGLLIYDFSDELDKTLYNNSWYIYENDTLRKMNFRDNEFSFVNASSDEKIDEYKTCRTFRYNRSINVIKLNCNISGNKIYIASFDEDQLKISVNGEDRVFYSSIDEVRKNEFIKNNNLTLEEYENMINIDFSKYSNINPSEFDTLYNSKESNYVAIVNNNISYTNISNYIALDKFISESKKNVILLNVSNISKEDAKNLHKKCDDFKEDSVDYVKDEIDIYLVGNKKIKHVEKLDFKNISDAKNYKGIE